jgi:hypothetical protein
MLSDGARAGVDSPVVAVVGLGCLGLPSEVEFGTHAKYTRDPSLPRADAMAAAVAHREYRELSTEDICRELVRGGGSFVDVKPAYEASPLEPSGVHVWRL